MVSVYFWVNRPGALQDGVYTAVSKGFGGDLEIAVTVENGKMTKIDVLQHHDTEAIAKQAFEIVIPAIIEAQSPDVDVATGATFTSNAIKEAVRTILLENR